MPFSDNNLTVNIQSDGSIITIITGVEPTVLFIEVGSLSQVAETIGDDGDSKMLCIICTLIELLLRKMLITLIGFATARRKKK